LILKIDPDDINMDKLDQAASIIKDGGLVAFPTETVYGLGANALDSDAVSRIFQAKGRPSDNPLIVHIADKEDVDKLAKEKPGCTDALISAFWPGPLTLIFKKRPFIPERVTAGLDTVAIRMPSHPVALALIKAAGKPIAAPSANRSGKPSPTLASHVIEDLSGRIEAIVDAGSASVGLESTVLDITTDPPMILRPGGITPDQLLLVLKEVAVDRSIVRKPDSTMKPRSPGMKYTHYSPKAEVVVIEGDAQQASPKIIELAETAERSGKRVGIMATDETAAGYVGYTVISSGNRHNPGTIASNLFRVLREFDKIGVDIIFAEGIRPEGIGLAVMNRLNKAAGYNIIKV
jgi:L-threonylcarbamoyladenylate synthase